MNKRTNKTQTWLVETPTQTFSEEAKATLGGFANMLDRITDRLDTTSPRNRGRSGNLATGTGTDNGEGRAFLLPNGETFTLTRVNKL